MSRCAKDNDVANTGDYFVRRLDTSEETIYGLNFICPCGCGSRGYLPLTRTPADQRHWLHWAFDGHEDAPTIGPSILQSGCQWHGYLINGQWEQCNGAVVPLSAEANKPKQGAAP